MSSATEPPPAPRARSPRPRRLGRAAAWGVALLALACVGAEALRVLAGSNTHTVLPGRVYRCAQPSADALQYLVERYGVRTVVNLRGSAPSMPWYQQEAEATCKLDLDQEDVSLSAGRLPSSSELRRLVEVFDQAAYPVVLHCRRGADRTGLAAAVALLLEEGVSPAQARWQLGPRYGHLNVGRPGRMADFFDYYETWLSDHGLAHSPREFRRYALEGYRGGPCQCVFEEVRLPAGRLRAGEPFALHVRVRNAGSQPWRLRPTDTAGHHLYYRLFGPRGEEAGSGRAGLFEADVPPGGDVELRVPVAGLPAGRYRLVLDMLDELMGPFYQMGSEPLELRLEVRD